MKKLKHFFLKSWFIAIIPAVLVILLLPDLFDQFEVKEVNAGTLTEAVNSPLIKFCDINHDGFSEQIISYSTKNHHSLQVLTYDGGLVEQWNMKGDIAMGNLRFVSGDFDNDQFDEVYPFTQTGDSIYINCF